MIGFEKKAPRNVINEKKALVYKLLNFIYGGLFSTLSCQQEKDGKSEESKKLRQHLANAVKSIVEVLQTYSQKDINKIFNQLNSINMPRVS